MADEKSKFMARLWSDQRFKEKFVSDPAGGLRDAGLTVPENVSIKVLEDTDSVKHFVLSAPPSEEGLSDAELEKIAAGDSIGYIDWDFF